jgi:ABC-type Na+ efflux pump permease subunit
MLGNQSNGPWARFLAWQRVFLIFLPILGVLCFVGWSALITIMRRGAWRNEDLQTLIELSVVFVIALYLVSSAFCGLWLFTQWLLGLGRKIR